jgi:anionic cell wall polymer biosynthesis LytR-Cps2A-Psr (LCP) family protein
MEPIRQAREEVTAEISAEYANIIRGQSIITGRLEAARRSSELQTALLNSVISKGTFTNFTERAVKLSEEIQTRIKDAKDYLKQKDIP